MGDACHHQRYAVDVDGAAYSRFVAAKQHVGHMFANDAYLAVLAQVNVVDEAARNDTLRQLVDKLRYDPSHLVLVALVTPHHILVTSKTDRAVPFHHPSEALANQFLIDGGAFLRQLFQFVGAPVFRILSG